MECDALRPYAWRPNLLADPGHAIRASPGQALRDGSPPLARQMDLRHPRRRQRPRGAIQLPARGEHFDSRLTLGPTPNHKLRNPKLLAPIVLVKADVGWQVARRSAKTVIMRNCVLFVLTVGVAL